MEDHDLLITIAKDMYWVKKIMGNHLKHHWMITLGACTAAIGGFITLIIVWLRGIV